VTDEALVAKLQIRPGSRLLLLGAPAGYRQRIDPLPGDGAIDEAPAAGATYDAVQVFCRDSGALAALAPAAIAAYARGRILLACYPKGGAKAGTDLNRDAGWAPLADAGLRPVRHVAIDETWSALRWRLVDEVGGGGR
jgi:hypothetical protein